MKRNHSYNTVQNNPVAEAKPGRSLKSRVLRRLGAVAAGALVATPFAMGLMHSSSDIVPAAAAHASAAHKPTAGQEVAGPAVQAAFMGDRESKVILGGVAGSAAGVGGAIGAFAWLRRRSQQSKPAQRINMLPALGFMPVESPASQTAAAVAPAWLQGKSAQQVGALLEALPVQSAHDGHTLHLPAPQADVTTYTDFPTISLTPHDTVPYSAEYATAQLPTAVAADTTPREEKAYQHYLGEFDATAESMRPYALGASYDFDLLAIDALRSRRDHPAHEDRVNELAARYEADILSSLPPVDQLLAAA